MKREMERRGISDSNSPTTANTAPSSSVATSLDSTPRDEVMTIPPPEDKAMAVKGDIIIGYTMGLSVTTCYLVRL